MLYSMTGFGSAAYSEGAASVSVELKAVNNRFFKLSLRVSDGYAALEPKVESVLRSVIDRGSINATVKIQRERKAGDYRIAAPVLQSYFEQLQDIAGKISETALLPAQLAQLVTLPGVIEMSGSADSDNETVWELVEKTIRQALNGLQEMRRTEGESMAKDLAANIELLKQGAAEVEKLAQRVAPQYRQRLKERIGALMSENNLSLNDSDLIREVAIYADRCDISEEIIRFKSHLEQFIAALQAKESAGRKLDFLTQELFRETNTMGAKANDADITKQVVGMKTVIEKIREMVQNVE